MRETHFRLFDIRMPALLPLEVEPALIAGAGEQRQRLEYRSIPLPEFHEAIAKPRGTIDARVLDVYRLDPRTKCVPHLGNGDFGDAVRVMHVPKHTHVRMIGVFDHTANQ